MARKPREEWSDNYRRRVERAEKKYGAIFEGDQARIRQMARGHRAREHVVRKERAIARGDVPISSADYAFLKKQRRRIPEVRDRLIGRRLDGAPVFINETAGQNYERAKRAYLRLSRRERDSLRHTQQRAERSYRGRNKRQPWDGIGGGSGSGRRQDFFASPQRDLFDEDEDEPDFDGDDFDWYEWVDEMDDDLTPMLFYK